MSSVRRLRVQGVDAVRGSNHAPRTGIDPDITGALGIVVGGPFDLALGLMAEHDAQAQGRTVSWIPKTAVILGVLSLAALLINIIVMSSMHPGYLNLSSANMNTTTCGGQPKPKALGPWYCSTMNGYGSWISLAPTTVTTIEQFLVWLPLVRGEYTTCGEPRMETTGRWATREQLPERPLRASPNVINLLQELSTWVVRAPRWRHDKLGVAMSRYSRSVSRSTVPGIVAAAIVIAGMIVVLGGSQAASPASTPGGLSHFLCYPASIPTTATGVVNGGFKPPKVVALANQFTRFSAGPAQIVEHCNPVQKVAKGVIYPIINPSAHLLCWGLRAYTWRTFVVQVTNQFGTAKLTTSQPEQLCLPTWKSLTGPPNKKPVQPPGLSHFTCYRVSYMGKVRFHQFSVRLTDQFGSFISQVGSPESLCVPTQKSVNGVVSPIINPRAHLTCFSVTDLNKPVTVFDENQFGTSQVVVGRANELCVPSTKFIVPPTTTTTSTTRTTTTTANTTTTIVGTGTTTTTIVGTGTTTTSPNQTTTTQCVPTPVKGCP